MKKFILLIIVLAGGIALGIYFQKQPQAQKIETQVQTDATQAAADVKEGAKKVDAAAAAVKAGVQKADALATNVEAHIKADEQKTGAEPTNTVNATNAPGAVKQ